MTFYHTELDLEAVLVDVVEAVRSAASVSLYHTVREAIFDGTVLPMLKLNGYEVQERTYPLRFVGSIQTQFVDMITKASDEAEIPTSISLQLKGGDKEDGVPFEVIKILKAIKESKGRFPYGYLILSEGSGWTLKDFYLSGGLSKYLADSDLVRIVTLGTFIELARRREL